jgi:phage pi2 protein 07
MSIKRIGLFLSLALVGPGTVALAQDQSNLLVKAPNVQKREVGSFHAISVSNAIDLVIKQGVEEGVAVSATDVATRDRIITKVENGVLKIYLNDNGWHWNFGMNNRKMKAFISFKTLDRLEASGASDVYVDGAIHSDNLAIELSGASDFKGSVQANQLEMHQSGSSDSKISGTSSNLRIHLSGASDFNGYDMITDICNVEASGSSDTHVTVNKELRVSTSGSSDVYYKGNADVKERNTSGSSSLEHKS